MSVDRFSLSGRVALVTGGGSGLGLAIARGLAAAGATVAINGRDRAKLEDAVKNAAQARLRPFAFDVSDADAARRGAGEVEAALGPIAVLVNGAAVFFASAASDYVTGQVLFVDGGFSASM